MINIAVCEDEKVDRDLLRLYLEQASAHLRVDYTADFFAAGPPLLEQLACGTRYDLIILDIIMADMNGMETARRVRKIMPEVFIGFMTCSADFALDAFELDALHYIKKPITERKVLTLLGRFLDRTGRLVKTLTLDLPRGPVAIPMDTILKVESYKKGVEIYLRDKTEPRWFHCSFMSVEDQLDKEQFIRISRGLIVNMDYIEHMEPTICCFTDGTSALISRGSRAQVRQQYNDYLFGRMRVMREKMEDD